MKYETQKLNDARKFLSGDFVELTKGFVHYQLQGPEDGVPVVLVHGFSSPFFVWDFNYQALVDAGFRVLRYDLYGRGLSDRPKARYDLDLFLSQLLELMEVLGLNRKKSHLVGLSMGGGICMAFASKHANLLSKMSLVAPAGLPMPKWPSNPLAKMPILNSILFRLIGYKTLLGEIPDSFYRPEKFPDYEKKYEAQMNYQGFARAILSTLMNFPLEGLQEFYHLVGKSKIPVQLFWGRQDKVLPFSMSAAVKRELPLAVLHEIDGCGHMPQYERPEKVNPALIDFLQG